MKKLVFLFLIIPFVIFSQCPDARSNEYKDKLAQYGDQSYAILATYYYYKCQCKNGINGITAQHVNSQVDTYNRLKSHSQGQSGISGVEGVHQTQWVTINTISESECSKSSIIKKDGDGNYNNQKSNYNKTANQSSEIVTDFIQGNTNSAGNKSVVMAVEGVIEGSNEKIVGGLALGLVSLFSKSKARENKPLTIEEVNRIKKLDKRRYNKLLEEALSKGALSENGVNKLSDTSLIMTRGDERIYVTHQPIKDHTKIFLKSAHTYNNLTGELKQERIIKEHYSNGESKVQITNNFKRGYSELAYLNNSSEITKTVNLINDKVTYDISLAKNEIIRNKTGKKIKSVRYFNDIIFSETFYKNDVVTKRKSYRDGIIESEKDVIFVNNTEIVTQTIDYDNRGRKVKKISASYEDFLDSKSEVTYYENDKPQKTIIYKKGMISKEILHN